MSPARRICDLALFAAVLSGCGDESRIRVSAVLPPPLSAVMLSVTVRDGERVIRWDGADFQPELPVGTPATPEVEIATSGPDLTLTYRLESEAGLLSAGSVTLPRRSDWRWHVTISAATTDPALLCFGCVGSHAFGLPEAFRVPERDSIWVVWGGNSISNPVVY
jgi:hypothetical protein